MENVNLASSLLSDNNNVTLWRVFHSESEDSIFKNGFTSEYFGDGEGSFHGVGLYSFYKPYGAEKRCGGRLIGDKIMKCVLLNGFTDFLILDKPIAMKYYNSDDIRTQLNYLYSDKKLSNAISEVYRKITGGFKLIEGKTGYISKSLYETFGNKLRNGKTRGIVYDGNNDPNACLIFNPREVIPVAVTNNKKVVNGDFNEWEYKITEDSFKKNQEILDFYSYGEKLKSEGLIKNYSKQPPINDCMLVVLPNGRKTMYDVKENEFISKYGFEECYGWDNIKVGEQTLYVLPVVPNKKSSVFYLKKNDNDGYYYFYRKTEDFEFVEAMSEYDKKGLLSESVSFDDSWLTVYHRTNSKTINDIFNKGFSKEYTASRIGNIAGVGVYYVFSLEDAMYLGETYGDSIIKCKLKNSLKDYLIPEGANINGKKITTNFKEQFSNLIYDSYKEYMLKKYDKILNRNDAGLVYKTLLNENELGKTKLRGVVYKYGDIYAGVAIDWKSLIPYEVTFDYGKTWKNELTSDRYDFIKSHGDSKFKLNRFISSGIIKNTFGNKNNDILSNQQFEEGYLRVVLTNGKISFYDSDKDDLVSYRGFDEGAGAQNMSGNIVIPVKIKNQIYYIYKEQDGNYSLYQERETFKVLKINNIKMNNKIYDKTYMG